MPYSPVSSKIPTMPMPPAADTGVVDDVRTIEATMIGSGALNLRRTSSASAVEPSISNLSAPSRSATVQTVPSPGGIFVHPPTPGRDDGAEFDRPATPPTIPRRARSKSPSPHTPSHRSSTPVTSPPSSHSSLGITIHGNVLPEVRSPRRNAEALPTRRSRRPRLFGFTGLVDQTFSAASSAASSVSNSPEQPSSPTETKSPARPAMLPRRNPVRTKSDTSLHTLPTAAPRRERRDTGLKLDLAGIVPATTKSAPQSAGIVPSPYNSIVKKKSGEVVKSALKYNGPLLPNGTPAEKDETRRRMYESRSCPTTPSCPKYVHFDSQLERVKLFLQNQKPLVVSRQGSPTEQLSDAEPDTETDAEVEKVLSIRLPNFPSYHPPDADMYLESLFLGEGRDSLRGVVVVRNIAFQKWVAVRFTFDWWQTVSEVTANYQDSIQGGNFDRFTFSLKLNDILDRIEEKTLFLCVRYSTPGREMWDSNGGENYQILFERKPKEQPRYMPKRTQTAPKGLGKSVARTGSAWSVTGSDADRMADLRARLNRLTAEDLELNAAPKKRGVGFRSPSTSPRRSTRAPPSADLDVPAPAQKANNLSSRYDFGSALKSSKLSPSMRPGKLPERHAATEFYTPRHGHFGGSPQPLPPSSPLSSLGSPLPVSPSPLPGLSSPLPGALSPGAHTPTPTSPLSPLPYTGPGSPLALAPPSLVSANSSSTTSLSSVGSATGTPADSPGITVREPEPSSSDTATESAQSDPDTPSSASESPLSPVDMLPYVSKERSTDDMSLASYSNFIQQFCWGGSAAPSPSVATDTSSVRRVHSTSSLDHYFATTPSEPLTPRATYTPTQNLSRSNSRGGTSTGATATPNRASRASPPSHEDLEHVDSAIRTLSALSAKPEGRSPPMTRIPSGMGARSPVLAN